MTVAPAATIACMEIFELQREGDRDGHDQAHQLGRSQRDHLVWRVAEEQDRESDGEGN